MITKFKLFEGYGSGPESELVEQLDDNFIETFYAENLAYTDVDEILSVWPSLAWDNIDNERAMKDVISDEIDSREMEEYDEYEIKPYLKDEVIDESDVELIYNKYIESEVDLEELEDLKNTLETSEEEDKESTIQEIKDITDRIEEIKELDFDDLVDEIDDDDILREIITDILDEGNFMTTVVENRYKGYDLKDYIEDIYGNVDGITFGTDYNNKVGDCDWILRYVDDAEVIKDYNNGNNLDYKKETIQDQIGNYPEIQRYLLKQKKSNALLLFDLFSEYSTGISGEYKFQNKYIKAYKKENSDEDNVVAVALKNLNDKFELNQDIRDKYVDDLFLVDSEMYNI